MKTDPKKRGVWPFAISSVLFTMFLCFIDEGNYNFEWMEHWGNWVAFLIYVVPIFFMQLLFANFILRKFKGFSGTVLSMFGGAFLGTLFVVFVIFGK